MTFQLPPRGASCSRPARCRRHAGRTHHCRRLGHHHTILALLLSIGLVVRCACSRRLGVGGAGSSAANRGVRKSMSAPYPRCPTPVLPPRKERRRRRTRRRSASSASPSSRTAGPCMCCRYADTRSTPPALTSGSTATPPAPSERCQCCSARPDPTVACWKSAAHYGDMPPFLPYEALSSADPDWSYKRSGGINRPIDHDELCWSNFSYAS